MNSKALLYCSVWPEDEGARSLDNQYAELQAYCLRCGLEAAGVEEDAGPSPAGSLRPGLSGALRRAEDEGLGHLVLWEPGQLGRSAWEALIWLRQLARRSNLTVHIAAWDLS